MNRDYIIKSVIQEEEIIQLRGAQIMSIHRSEVTGCLEENLLTLHRKLKSSISTTAALHYRALCEVAKFILQNGPLVKTKGAGQ